MIRKIQVLFLSFCGASPCLAQEVELVVTTGFDFATCIAFSHDNRLLAKLALDKVSLWDVATGRVIRTVDYTEDISFNGDSLWFSPDDSNIEVASRVSNDRYFVSTTSKKCTLIKGAPFDYTDYKYQYSNSLIGAMFFNDKSRKQVSFTSPDGNHKLILSRIPYTLDYAGLTPHQMLFSLQIGKQEPIPVDSGFGFYYGFSSDSKLLYLNGAVFSTEVFRIVSRTQYAKFSGSGVAFVPGTHIPVTCGTKSVRFWNFPDVEDVPLDFMMDFYCAPGYRYAVAEQFDEKEKKKRYSVIDLSTKKILSTFTSPEFMAILQDVDVNASRISQFFVKYDPDNPTKINAPEARITNTSTGEVEHTIKKTFRAYFTSDPNELRVDSMYMNYYRYDMGSGKTSKFQFDSAEFYMTPSGYSNNKLYAMINETVYIDSSIKAKPCIYNTLTGKRVFSTIIDSSYSVLAFEVSPDNRLIAFGTLPHNDIHVYALQTGQFVCRLQGHTGFLTKIAFSDDGKRLLSSSGFDGSKRLWNLETGKEMVALISTDEKDYAIVTPQNYYYATKGAQKFIHFVKGQEIFPFEQFDLKYNRPDIIIESMEASNQDLKEPFYRAYLKRLQRLGYSEDMLSGEFHLPKVSVANRDQLPFLSASRTVSLDVTAIDSKYLLDRMMVRINGVPLDGSRGADLMPSKSQHIKQQIEVTLSEGVNHIAVSAMNEKGVESIPVNMEIKYISEQTKLPVLYLVTLGVSEYKDAQFNLNYAAKDSRDVMARYAGQAGIFSEVKQIHYENAQVTTSTLDEIRNVLIKSTEDDIVLMFFAGHGMLDQDLNYYLAAHDVNFQNPAEGGIRYENLEGLLDGIPARKKILMIDACHSGEIDKEEVAWVESSEPVESTEGDVTFRAVTSGTFKQIGLQNSFEMMKELFTDIRKSSGTVVISSAGGTEYAMEGAQWKNGIFTYCLLNGLASKAADLDKDGVILLGEISRYMHDQVSLLTGGRQSPTTRAENLDSDWRMW